MDISIHRGFPLSHTVGLRCKHVVTVLGSGALNRFQLLEASLSTWSALDVEITTLQTVTTALVQSSLLKLLISWYAVTYSGKQILNIVRNYFTHGSVWFISPPYSAFVLRFV